ncbi:MAG: hypothetical protein ACM3ZU_15760 [Bacteroidota bacterium]
MSTKPDQAHFALSEADDEKHDQIPLELRVLVTGPSYRLVDLSVKGGAFLPEVVTDR